MASGFGFQGGPGRCSAVWLAYSKCVDACESGDPVAQCKPLRGDYLECLHHKLEYARRNQVARRLAQLRGKVPEEEEEGGAAAAGHGHGGH